MIIKNIQLIFLLCLFSIITAHGDDHEHSHKKNRKSSGCTVLGIVKDSLTTKPIEYASISIFNSNNEVMTGGISNSLGEFKIKDIKPGSYSAKIEFMGYTPIKYGNIILSYGENKRHDLGTIMMQTTSIEINAVKVIDEKPIFEFEADKMVYNSSDDIVAGSGTAEDVLNKVPMVTVDSDGEVSLRGNPNVKILINGRQNRQGGEVDNIPASLIDKVEVITSPSAKYDPEGMAGIINIILKKGEYEGLNGSIKMNGKHNEFNSFNDKNGITIYSNYQAKKYNVYSSLSINSRANTRTSSRQVYNTSCIDSEPCYPDGDKFYAIDGYNYSSKTQREGSSSSFKIGSDYSIKNNLKINGEFSYKKGQKTKNVLQQYLQDGIDPLDYDKNTTEGDDDGNYHWESFFEVIKSYDNPDKELYLSTSRHFSIDNEFETLNDYTSNVDEDEDNYDIDFNYKSPINENSKFEIGYDGRFIDTSEKLQFELSGLSGINNFTMSRKIHGFFAEYQVEINEKVSVKPSIRMELVDKNISFLMQNAFISDGTSTYAQLLKNELNDTTLIVDEINFFPDFHFTYNITDKKSLQLGISRRIERAGGGSHGSWGQLRPFPRNVYNDSFIFLGDPTLKPEFSTQYEISYKSPMPMGFFYTNLFYRDITNSIEWYDYDGENNDLNGNVVTFVNADKKATDKGIELFMMIMGQTIGGGYNINELNDGSNDFQLNGKNERLNMYMRINLPEKYIKVFGFEFGFYYMKMKVPGGTLFGDSGSLWANTGLSKSLFDDRMSLSLSLDNIFDQGGFQMNRYQPVSASSDILQYTNVDSKRGGRTLSLNIKYNFGKMQEEKRKGRGRGFGGGGNEMDMGY